VSTVSSDDPVLDVNTGRGERRERRARTGVLPDRQHTIGWLSRNGIFFALLLLIAYFSLASERFFSASNFEVVLVQTAIVGIVAIPGAVLVLAGYVDLSVGSVTVLTAIIFGSVFDSGGSIVVAAIVALCVAVVCGLVSATLIAIFGMSPIIVTLGGLAAARGVAEVVSHGETVFGFGKGFAWIGNGEFLDVRMPAWTFLLVVLIGAYVWYQSPYGRHMMAIGSNREAAHSLGIGIRRIPFILYVASAFFCGIAGLLYASRLDGASLSIGDGMELQVLTAILLGGVAFTGGEGGALGALAGAVFLLALLNVVTLSSLNPFMQLIIQGAVMLVAVSVFQFLKKSPAN